MRAVVVDRWTEPEELRVREAPDPEVTPGMLGIDVRAAGCNFFDLLLVRGDPTRDIAATAAIDRVWKNGFAVAIEAPPSPPVMPGLARRLLTLGR